MLLGIIVFIGGVSSIAIEVSASRLVGPYFGESTFIWANLIGLTLLYLTIGYFIGGRIADRWPSSTLLFAMTATAGASIAFIPMISRPILRVSLQAFNDVAVGQFYGSLLGTMLLFALPITLLGCIAPFAVRLRINLVEGVGNTAGSLYALSTVGSIVGSVLPTFLLIPAFGTRTSFLILSLALLIPSTIALASIRAVRAFGFAIALVALVALMPVIDRGGLIRPPEYGEIIHERETRYNYVQVIDLNGEIRLALNEGHATHSIYNPDRLLTQGPWDYFMVGPYFNADHRPEDVQSLLLIGLAAGTVAKQFTFAYGSIPIDGVEIDGEIADVGREYFDMNEPNLNVIVDDGRYYLERTDTTYDVIGIDAYRQPYIPFHLTTREFFQEVSDSLTDDGVAVINAGRTRTDFRLVEVIASTMADVYPNVYIIDVARFTNSIVIGTKQPTEIANFAENILRLPEDSLIRIVGEASIELGNMREWTEPGQVFTDDLAPVELVVDQIIIGEATRDDRN
ncbi:MAG TPA: fused MFS/spermidine synthase [Thermomicrobiales bacterium]|nr:fused MFS/spermidine synthase [Thermomicrobiales bacterium]